MVDVYVLSFIIILILILSQSEGRHGFVNVSPFNLSALFFVDWTEPNQVNKKWPHAYLQVIFDINFKTLLAVTSSLFSKCKVNMCECSYVFWMHAKLKGSSASIVTLVLGFLVTDQGMHCDLLSFLFVLQFFM